MSNYIDFNNDGISGNIADLVYLTSNLSTISNSYSKQYDVNQDNIIDASDVEYLANHIVGNSGYELPKYGLYVQNKENGNLSIGYSNTINGNNSIIIGNNSTSNYNNTIAIGNNLSINSSNEIILGNDNTNNILIGNVKIVGDLSLNGIMHIVDTNVNTTEMLHIENDGVGPALIVNQTGIQPVLDIQDDGNSCLYIKNGGNVGIGTNEPNNTLDVSGNLNVNGKSFGFYLIGTIIMWSGNYIDEQSNLNDSGWYLCDGNNSVQVNEITIPDLTNKFVRGSSTVGQLGGSDDAIVVTHTHEVEQQGLHNHIASIQQNGSHNHGGNSEQGTTGSHSHGVDSSTHRHQLEEIIAPTDDFNYTWGWNQIGGLMVGADGTGNFNSANSSFGTQLTPSNQANNREGEHSHGVTSTYEGNHSHSIQQDGLHNHETIISQSESHIHNIISFGESGIGANIPSYYTLAFLIFVGYS